MPELVAGRYELVREVGRGASATVYRAYDRTLDRYIAIKLVSPALANDPDFVDRFLREARMAAGLNHPNIVTVHDAGEADDGRPVLAMELVEGASLEAVISEHAPLPTAEAMRVLGEIAGALEYLHGQGLVHRDVTPSNILLAESGRVVLSDFGIAYARESARYTNTGVMLGTPRYMAPEQFKGEAPTPATDVYALGVIAFELLSGAPPFDGTGTALMYRIVHEPPPPVTTFAPHVTPGLEAVIAKALAKDPGERWSTPAEFLTALSNPDTDATMLGDSALLAPVVQTPAQVEAPPVEESTAIPPGPQQPGGADATAGYSTVSGLPASAGIGGRGRGGRMKGMAGAFGAGIIGFGLAGYCMATGGILPAGSDGGDDPTPTVAAADSETPSDSDDTRPSPTSRATRTPSPTPGTVTALTTTTPGVTPDSTHSPAATATPAPANTPVPAPSPTNTLAPTATNTPGPTSTNTPAPTATNTHTPKPTATHTPTATPTATPAPPHAPSNVTRSGNTLSWSDNSKNEQGFRIYWRAEDLNSDDTFGENDKTVGPNVTTTTVDTINLIGTTTNFRRGVSAYNAAGESAIAWE